MADANVWVSAALYERSVPARVVNLLRSGTIVPLVSDELVDQVERALDRLHFAPDAIRAAVDDMRAVSVLVVPTVRLAVISAKESANRILELAVAGRADVIVTGDRKHLLPLGSHDGIPIVAPADFLASFDAVDPA